MKKYVISCSDGRSVELTSEMFFDLCFAVLDSSCSACCDGHVALFGSLRSLDALLRNLK